MSRKQFHFLSPNTGASGLPADRKAVQAARNEARSHSARVSYPSQNRLQRGGGVGDGYFRSSDTPDQLPSGSEEGTGDISTDISSPESASSPTTCVSQGSPGSSSSQSVTPKVLRFRLYDKKDRPKKRPGRKAPSPPAKVPKAISKSSLDPFVSPAVDLSVPDEHLLHLYLSTVPDELYGKSSGSASEVVREGTLGVVANNNIVLMWLLLTVESQVVSFQPTKKDRQLSILTRRAQAYKLMNERLTAEEGSPLDFAFTIAVAASCEHRMANPTVAKQHIGAVQKLLAIRGGSRAVRNITYPLGLMVVNILVEQGIPALFDSREQLRLKLKATLRRLRDYQAWNHDLSFSDRNPMRIENCLATTSKDGLPRVKPDHLHMRAHAFRMDSALGKFVALPTNEVDEPSCRFLLSVIVYLKELTAAAELSIAANFVLRAGGSKLPSLLMLVMLAHKAANEAGRDPSTSAVFHDEEVFEFVNLIMMARPITRITKALSSWLTTGVAESKEGFHHLSDSLLSRLEHEVEEMWLSDQTRRLAQMNIG